MAQCRATCVEPESSILEFGEADSGFACEAPDLQST